MLEKIRSSFNSVVVYGFGNLSTKLVGFVLLPLYVSHISVYEFGVFGLLEVSSTIIVQLFSFGLGAGLQRWYYDPDKKDSIKSIFFTLIVFLGIVNLFLFSLLFYCAPYFVEPLLGSTSYLYTIRLMLVVSGFTIFFTLPKAMLRVEERAGFYTLSMLQYVIITLAMTIILIVKYKHGITGIYEAQLFGVLGDFILLSPYIVKRLSLKFEKGILKEILSFSIPISLATLFGLILVTADRYMLKVLIPIEAMLAVGLYSFAYKIANVLKISIVDSLKLALPAMYFKYMSHKEAKRFYSKILTYSSFVFIFTALILSVLIDDILVFFGVMDSDYSISVTYIPAIMLGIVFNGITNITNYGISISKKTKLLTYNIIIVSILSIVLNYFSIPRWGIWGAVMSGTISQAIFSAISYYQAQKNYPIPYEIHKLILMLMMAILLYFTTSFFSFNNIWVSFFIKASLVLLFPFLLYPFHFYEPIELLRLRQSLEKWRKPESWKKPLRKH